jgi:hypothetical protein
MKNSIVKMYYTGRVIYTGTSLKAAMYAAKHESERYIAVVDVIHDGKLIGCYKDGHFTR